MKKYFKKIIILISLILILVFPFIVLAASESLNNLNKVGSDGSTAPYAKVNPGQNDLAGIVGIVIRAFLGILGVLFLIYTIYAGYGWMTAQGEEEKVTKAKDTLTRAVIGLIISIGAYALTAWVFDKLLTATNILN